MTGKLPFLKDKSILLTIEYAKSNRWDIKFIDEEIPNQFRSFFPAKSVVEPVFSTINHEFEIGNSTLEIPHSTKTPSLTIEFYDNHNCELETFLEKWANQKIYGNYKSVLPVESSTKTIQIKRINNFGDKVFTTTYSVYPKGDITRTSNSDSEFISFTVDFTIVSMRRQ